MPLRTFAPCKYRVANSIGGTNQLTGPFGIVIVIFAAKVRIGVQCSQCHATLSIREGEGGVEAAGIAHLSSGRARPFRRHPARTGRCYGWRIGGAIAARGCPGFRPASWGRNGTPCAGLRIAWPRLRCNTGNRAVAAGRSGRTPGWRWRITGSSRIGTYRQYTIGAQESRAARCRGSIVRPDLAGARGNGLRRDTRTLTEGIIYDPITRRAVGNVARSRSRWRASVLSRGPVCFGPASRSRSRIPAMDLGDRAGLTQGAV